MHRFKLSTNNKRPWKNAKQNSISAFPHLGVATMRNLRDTVGSLFFVKLA